MCCCAVKKLLTHSLHIPCIGLYQALVLWVLLHAQTRGVADIRFHAWDGWIRWYDRARKSCSGPTRLHCLIFYAADVPLSRHSVHPVAMSSRLPGRPPNNWIDRDSNCPLETSGGSAVQRRDNDDDDDDDVKLTVSLLAHVPNFKLWNAAKVRTDYIFAYTGAQLEAFCLPKVWRHLHCHRPI